MPDISTHTFRHLRLTHLARAGWKLHELATYAGHRDPATTQIYIHLSGRDLAARMTSLGYAPASQKNHISRIVATLMIVNRDPRLETFTPDQL